MADDAYDGPPNPSIDDAVAAWLRWRTLRTETDFWAWDYVKACGPNEKWAITKRLLAEGTDDALPVIAAGPLEELVYAAGQWARRGHDAWIGVIEGEAARSPRLREALAGVWPEDDDPDELWRRLDAILGSRVAERHPRRQLTAEEQAWWAEMDARFNRMMDSLPGARALEPKYEPPNDEASR